MSASQSPTRLLRLTGWSSIVLLALVALPLGSNRPAFWAIGALVVGLLAITQFGVLSIIGTSARIAPRWQAPTLAVALLYLTWMIVQILPLASLLGGPFITQMPAGVLVSHDSLSLAPGQGRLAVLRTAGYGMLFLCMLEIASNRARARRLMLGITLMVLGWGIYAIVALEVLGDTILTFEKWAYLGSATGPFVNRNAFADFLAMGLIAGVGLCVGRATGPAPERPQRGRARQRSHTHKRNLLDKFSDPAVLTTCLLALTCAILAAVLLRTGSRMGVASAAVGATLTLGLITIRRWKLARLNWRSFLGRIAALSLALGAITAFAIRSYGNVMFERLGSVDRDADIRLELYRQILGMIAARPWAGWGADSFVVVFPAFRRAPVNPEVTWDYAHSTYLAHWAEMGLIAGSIPLFLVAAAFFACLRAALYRADDIVLPAIGVGVIASVALHSLVDFGMEMQANVWLFAAILALALGSRKRNKS